MNDTWIQLVTAACGAWVAWELRQLRRDVSHRIHYSDCDRRMNEHARRLTRLEDRLEKNS